MKLNKKGFTMIELLAVLVIMAILSGVAITGTNRYMENARNKAYEALEDTLYLAAQNYIIDNGTIIPKYVNEANPGGRTFTDAELKDAGYIKELQDPATKDDLQCSGSVHVTRYATTTTKLDEYVYKVNLQCSGYSITNKEYKS